MIHQRWSTTLNQRNIDETSESDLYFSFHHLDPSRTYGQVYFQICCMITTTRSSIHCFALQSPEQVLEQQHLCINETGHSKFNVDWFAKGTCRQRLHSLRNNRKLHLHCKVFVGKRLFLREKGDHGYTSIRVTCFSIGIHL